MFLSRRAIVIAAVLSAIVLQSLAAQGPYANGPGPGGSQTSARAESRGTVSGTISRLNLLAVGSGWKEGSVGVALDDGTQSSFDLATQTQYQVQGLALSSARVKALLEKGVPVELEWVSGRDRGARTATIVRIRTVEITGSLNSLRDDFVNVFAKPLVREEVPTGITAAGRHKQTGKTTPPPAKPRRLRFKIVSAFTQITLDGKPALAKDLQPRMAFDALVMDGGPRFVFELHARTGSSSASRP